VVRVSLSPVLGAFLLAALPLCSVPAQEFKPEERPAAQPEEQPEEKPAEELHDIRFKFEGNENLGSKALGESLSALRADLRRHGVDQGAVDDAVYELTQYCFSQGYCHAKVSATWAPKEAEFVVSFRIEEGLRSIVKEVSFAGNEHFPSEELARCFTWLKSGMLQFGDDVYTEGVLDDGVNCVTARYEIEGYYFVKVSRAVEEKENGEVLVRVSVEEGPQIFLEIPPAFEGVTVTSEEALLKVLGLVDPEAPIPYEPRLPPGLQGKLFDHYRNLGYRFVEVEVDRNIDPETARATLRFKIEEGPLTHIRAINPVGNEWTRDWVIFKRISLKAGDLYNEDKLRHAYRSLLRSGLFSSVSLEARKVEGSEGLVDLDVTVSEKPRYRAAFLAGWGSYELLRGGIVLENINFFGTGHRLRFEGKGSFRGAAGSVEYLNPYFFFEELSHNIKGLAEVREHPSFTETRLEGDTGWNYRISDQLRTGLRYQIRESNVDDVGVGVPPQLVEDVLISSVAVSGVFDNRNSIVVPTKGITTRLTVEYSGDPIGSELDFMRYVASAGFVLPLLQDVQLVTSARVGVIQPIAGTDTIPIQERFFNGGEYTIRSFLQDEAGPEFLGDPIGGEAMTVLNVELRFPLFLLDNLRGAVFFDTGTLTARAEDIGGGRQFFGLGPAVRYNTPIGPVRLDVGWNPDRERGEPEFVFHFGLGYPF